MKWQKTFCLNALVRSHTAAANCLENLRCNIHREERDGEKMNTFLKLELDITVYTKLESTRACCKFLAYRDLFAGYFWVHKIMELYFAPIVF